MKSSGTGVGIPGQPAARHRRGRLLALLASPRADRSPPPTSDVVLAGSRLHATVPSVQWLRHLAVTSGDDRIDELTVVITKPERYLPAPSMPRLTSMTMFQLFRPGRPKSALRVELSLSNAQPASLVLAALVQSLEPMRRLPAVLAVDSSDQQPRAPESTPIEVRNASPRGRQQRVDATGATGVLLLESGPDEVRMRLLDGAGAELFQSVLGEPWRPDQVAAVKTLRAIECPHPVGGPAALATLFVQVAMYGTGISVAALPEPVAELAGPELAGLISQPVPAAARDATQLAPELYTIRQRRAAMRRHAAGLATPGFPHPDIAFPSVSALLVTRRPELLKPALAMLDAQSYPHLEIVLGLHGFEPGDRLQSALAGIRAPLQVVAIPAAATLGEAMGLVSLRARGSLLTKVDDDDFYGPGHLWDLVHAIRSSGAQVVGKAAEFVHLEQLGISLRRTMGAEKFVEYVAGGTIMMSRADLEWVGGWRPVPHGVDRCLLDRVIQDGGRVYRTHPFGFIHRRHGQGHTWDPGLEYFLRSDYPQWPDLIKDVLV